MKINQTEIVVVHGSVIAQDVEAIVNAANTMMRGGGGIDGAIHAAAGRGLLEELRRIAPSGAPTASAVVTGGHDLKQRYIVHVAGPIYRNHPREEAARLLGDCYRNCLEAAAQNSLNSIGFPSISTGAYGYPLEAAAPLALNTVARYFAGRDSPLRRVVFAMFGAVEFEAFARVLQSIETANN